jgi:LAO/AO transport system kinase
LTTTGTAAAPKTISYATHRALARAISAVENAPADAAATLDAFERAHPPPPVDRGAYVVGITGPPGAGKSTLVDKLIGKLRALGSTVAVIAVDPSSPFTKGAVLGDRVRMQQHSGDAGVFIRSMASREAGGGLAPATAEAVRLAARAGFDVVVIETVGVGQVELEIVSVADVIAVVTVPALGDGVQTIKAGLTEIADIFVVNMADRPGANQTALDLLHMVRDSGRDVPVLQTVASAGTGVDEVVGALLGARDGRSSNAERAVRFEVVRVVRDEAARATAAALDSPAAAAILSRLAAHELPRTEAVRELLALVRTNRSEVRPG